jgi:ribosomal protein S18 acetylase RimI-like enzyme
MDMQIEHITSATEELIDTFQRLIPQLTTINLPPTGNELDAIVRSESSILVAARASGAAGQILGVGCLIVYRVPTGVRGIIEDVVVDDAARGQGIGEGLVRALLDIANEKGAKVVTLTCNPKRVAANRLYQRIGFTRRDTNAYIYKF